MQGEDVRQLQEALKKAGIAVKVDGVFGADTDKLVKQFQQQKKLEADGIVGAGTRKVLGL
jgi:peptidoglycan hydrolase-like protein with peptidoglycan-binding domain